MIIEPLAYGRQAFVQLNWRRIIIDELVKSRKTPFFVIPAKAGIQFFNWLQSFWTPPGLDPGSTGVTTFYETIII